MSPYRRAKLLSNLEKITIEIGIVLSIVLLIERLRPVC